MSRFDRLRTEQIQTERQFFNERNCFHRDTKLQLSIHSKTVQIFIQVLVMNSVSLIYYFLIQEWLRNNFPSENLDDLSAEILAEFIVNSD